MLKNKQTTRKLRFAQRHNKKIANFQQKQWKLKK